MKDTFASALRCLPRELGDMVQRTAADAEELRLRAGQPLSLVERTGRERILYVAGQPLIVTPELLRRTLETATCASYHAAVEKLCRGFLPLPGGHRLGVSGSVELRDGRIHGFRSISSLCLRVAHEMPGVGERAAELLFGEEVPRSALILAPPGAGKTTLLRDIIRLASDRFQLRTGLADERGEVAALCGGVPQLDVGRQTDVLDGCTKGDALLLLLRSMNPQLLAADEITAPEDIAALSSAANCGVAVLATAHGGSRDELRRRPLYRRLMEEQIFTHLILLHRHGVERTVIVEALDDEIAG